MSLKEEVQNSRKKETFGVLFIYSNIGYVPLMVFEKSFSVYDCYKCDFILVEFIDQSVAIDEYFTQAT